MAPRIAIPLPRSDNPDYVERALPQYERAIEQAGGEPVRIPLDLPPAEVMKVIEGCDAVLLPGSSADVDPSKYGAQRHPKTAAADPKRDTVDELLLQDAYNMHKPILGICYGLQSLNVYRTGTLVQDIESELHSKIPHEAGRAVQRAHTAQVDPVSNLARLLGLAHGEAAEIAVNSSHHQAAGVVGDGLRVAARSPLDGIIEAVEGTAPDHFVLAVQWHPERTYAEEPESRKIFRALIEAARARHESMAGEFESLPRSKA
jgi:putative glutamine amidotransferase